MRLKNKKTGEIVTLIVDGAYKFVTNFAVEDDEMNRLGEYNSLAELNEEWEDYEEPKEHWCITMYGGITRIKDDEEPIDDLIEIGNYFNSKEDAYDAWDKLKAWKRLREAGFEFRGWTHTPITKSLTGYNLHIKAYSDKLADYMGDLQLIFGGEE